MEECKAEPQFGSHARAQLREEHWEGDGQAQTCASHGKQAKHTPHNTRAHMSVGLTSALLRTSGTGGDSHRSF